MVVKKKPSSPSIRSYTKAGFGFGLGGMLSGVVFIAVAALLFVPGFIIVTKQNKKPKEERSTGMLVLGFVLMGIGMIVGLGFGATTFFSSLGDSL